MSLQINALHLHEIDYEIRIRDITPKGGIEDKRKILRGLLAQESENRSFLQIKNPYDFKTDIKEITDSIENLKTKVDGFSGVKNDSKYKSLITRLWHVSGRINRVNVDDSDEETEKKK